MRSRFIDLSQKTRRATLVVVAFCLAVPPLVALATPSGDGVRTTYPGLACKFYDPQGRDTFLDPGGYGANGLKNTSSSTKYVACPIAKPDYDIETQRMGYTRFTSIYLDTSADVCKFYVRAQFDGAVSWFAVGNILGRSNGLYRHSIGGINYLITYARSASWYCGVPSQRYISNYEHEVYWRDAYNP